MLEIKEKFPTRSTIAAEMERARIAKGMDPVVVASKIEQAIPGILSSIDPAIVDKVSIEFSPNNGGRSISFELICENQNAWIGSKYGQQIADEISKIMENPWQ